MLFYFPGEESKRLCFRLDLKGGALYEFERIARKASTASPATIKMERLDVESKQLKITKVPKKNANGEVSSVKFFPEENREEFLAVNGIRDFVKTYMVKMVWTVNGNTTGKYIASVH